MEAREAIDAQEQRRRKKSQKKSNDARTEVKTAEKKVADGIAQIFAEYKPKNKGEYDAQGIATVEISYEKLKENGIADQFPNNGERGITVHFYGPNYIPHPPLRYMVEQKVKSLCKAVAIVYDQDENEIINKIWPAIEKKLKAEMEANKEAIKDPEKFHKKAKELMAVLTGQALVELHDAYAPNKKYEKFTKEIIKVSTNHRSNDESILTLDEQSRIFSYDHVVSPTTAHDRDLGKPCANLSIVFEGKYNNKDGKTVAAVTSSVVKHASLPPIDKLSSIRLLDPNESNIDILIDTCNHIEEVAKAMATLRQHGKEDNGPIAIDWTYQLLTSNAFNRDKQAITYGYITKAANLMNGAQLIASNQQAIDLSFNVFNAGLNSVAQWNLAQKTDSQRYENRKAFIHLSENLNNHVNLLPPNLMKLCTQLDTPKSKELINKNHDFLKQQSNNAKQFGNLRQQFNELKKSLDNKKLPRHEKKNLQNKLIRCKKQIRATVKRSQRINKKIRQVTYQIEKEQKAQWQKHGAQITSVINNLPKRPEMIKIVKDLDSPDEKIRNQAAESILAIAALTYKVYMNELYYDKTYREPKNAAMFNTYMAAYQHIIGMTASTGCKSANDRTYVARLFLAAMEGRDHKELLRPPPVHRDAEAFKNLQSEMSQRAMTNSASISCINDNGGTPKVSANKFKSLSEVKYINFVGKFGDYAAHKIKGMAVKLKNIYMKSLKADEISIKVALPQTPPPGASVMELAKALEGKIPIKQLSQQGLFKPKKEVVTAKVANYSSLKKKIFP